MTIGVVIKHYRKKRKLTITQLSNKSGVPEYVLREIEAFDSEGAKIGRDVLERLSDMLKINYPMLVALQGDLLIEQHPLYNQIKDDIRESLVNAAIAYFKAEGI